MTLEWVRFWVVAAFLLIGVFSIFVSILGTFRFHYALNRIHSAAMIDTLGFLSIMAGLMIAEGFTFSLLKFALVIVLMWVANPISSHMLTMLEYVTDEQLAEHCDIKTDAKDGAKGEK